MLSALHVAMRRLVHEHGQVPESDVDVCFDPPRRDWIASLTRPTLSFFLFDVRENTELRQAARESSRVDGRAVHRMPPRRFDLHYLVSALTTVVEDEHLLLWRTLWILLRHPGFPHDVLTPALRALDPALSATIGTADDGKLLDVWSALEATPRPALLYIVTAPVDLDLSSESPLVLTRTTRYAEGAEVRTHIGGVVRDAGGVPQGDVRVTIEGSAAAGAVTRADGSFVLQGVPAGAVMLRVTRAGRAPVLRPIAIPSDSYEVVVD